jgi:[acyl-carrier-protein] S-malonyltransferase
MSTAILFPGQGSQSIGMLADIAESFPEILDTFRESGDALGYDMWDMCQQGPADRLNSTEITQPAVLTADIALFRLLQSRFPVNAAAVAGHSLGEYSALVASGVIDLATAVVLVEKRGNLMKAAVAGIETAMAAILGLSDDQVVEICAQVADGQCVEAVNFNTPGQVVVGGQKEAVERAIVALKAAGARRAVNIAVSVPAHSSLMKPAADALADTILTMTMKPPAQPVIQNVDAMATSDLDVIRSNLIKQVYVPVQWTQTMQTLIERGCNDFIECGPGKVLAGLVKKIDRQLPVKCLTDITVWE